MTKEELLEKAIYIQYPLKTKNYNNCKVGKKIYKLPIPKDDMMYNKWKYNDNHFTMEYHRKYSLPLLKELLNINYNESDFVLKERFSDGFDISIFYPKNEYKYEIYGFNHNEHFDDLKYDEITHSDVYFQNITDYHKLFKYPHENSRLINKTINNCRKLFISGDSQMIPDVPILSCYFNEIWYADNRENLILSDKWKNIDFTDVLIEINDRELNQYVNINFK